MTDTPLSATTPEMLVASLLALLDVEPLERGYYRGMRKPGGVGRVFGGQVIAQALAAATKEMVPDKLVHSLHAYFMRGGDEDYPIDFRVEADFDGASFANRRVVAIQKDKPILNLVASFQRREPGLSHQFAMPDVPPPDDLVDQSELARLHMDMIPEQLRRFLTRPNPYEVRHVGLPPMLRREKSEPVSHLWFRTRAPVDAPQHMHRIILAMITDIALLSSSMLPHAGEPAARNLQTASLDHAIWFHADVAVDDWLLYTMDSPWSGNARGFNRGMIFRQDGALVASCTQEGLIRPR